MDDIAGTMIPGTSGRDIAAAMLDRLLSAAKNYRRHASTTPSMPGRIEPERFCSDLLVELEQAFGAGGVAPFLASAMATQPRLQMAVVLACLTALGQGETKAAIAHARRACALDSRDLLAQDLLRRVSGEAAPDLSRRFCRMPFDTLETAPGGDAYFCCPSWLPVPIGNIERQDAAEIWNSDAARDIRESILDGSYRYCSKQHCPHITGDRLPKREAVAEPRYRSFMEGRQTRLEQGPRTVVLSHDRSCNLTCPSCRTKPIVARKAEQDRLDAVVDTAIVPLLRDAKRLKVTGSGDPFASAHFRHVLKRVNREDCPRLVIDLQTNGVLFDRASWDDLELEGLVDNVAISMDAATPETYGILRRGGSFPRLLENLEFVAELRRRRAVGRVRLDAVVQALNIRELADIVAIARRFGFDGVKLQMIRNWGTYSPEIFAAHHIGSPAHPEHGVLLEVIEQLRGEGEFVELWGMAGLGLVKAAA